MTMIDIFTNHLPSIVAQDIKEQYQKALPIFTAYIDSPDSRYNKLKEDKELAYFLLALAIFYSSVVVPLKEAKSFFDFMSTKDITSVRIGNYSFSEKAAWDIEKMYSSLNGIFTRYQIHEGLLLFSDLKTFARNLDLHFKNIHNENKDPF
jgi:hypothetical protein